MKYYMIAFQIPGISCSIYEFQPEHVESRLTSDPVNKNNDRTETNSNPGEFEALRSAWAIWEDFV